MPGPRILLVKLSAIGDCLHASPVVAALRGSFPDAHLGWAVHAHCTPIVVGQPGLDRVHILPRKKFLRHLPGFAAELKRERYDLAIDLQGLLKSALVTRLSGANRRIGPLEAREGAAVFYNERVARQVDSMHVIEGYLALAKAAGASWTEEPPMYMPVTEADRVKAHSLLPEKGPLVVLNPSAGKAIKQWAPASFAAVGDQLVEELGAHLLITGAPSDAPLGEAILAALKHQSSCTNLIGKTSLTELAAVLGRVDLFVGGDTGPMHLAQAMGTKTLAIFGPTNPDTLGPRLPMHAIESLRLDCSPCRHRECPIGHLCLKNLEPSRVAGTAMRMLKG